MATARIVTGALPPAGGDTPVVNGGAELIFHGRVRPVEEGREIVALDYEHYAGMAERQLAALVDETERRFELLRLEVLHRVGRVPVGEPSLRVTIWSRHRGEGLAALAWLVNELKQHVPIWKWGVTAAGERFPSHHAEPVTDSHDVHGGHGET